MTTYFLPDFLPDFFPRFFAAFLAACFLRVPISLSPRALVPSGFRIAFLIPSRFSAALTVESDLIFLAAIESLQALKICDILRLPLNKCQ